MTDGSEEAEERHLWVCGLFSPKDKKDSRGGSHLPQERWLGIGPTGLLAGSFLLSRARLLALGGAAELITAIRHRAPQDRPNKWDSLRWESGLLWISADVSPIWHLTMLEKVARRQNGALAPANSKWPVAVSVSGGILVKRSMKSLRRHRLVKKQGSYKYKSKRAWG